MQEFRPWEMIFMCTLIGVASFIGGCAIGDAGAEARHIYKPNFMNQACVQVDEAMFCR